MLPHALEAANERSESPAVHEVDVAAVNQDVLGGMLQCRCDFVPQF